ncbi:MAG: restriction endonuclease subunit S, partial [Thermoplasmata archaeon]|nr:restriction endonuclease subunit S [Thermoplasmata archaeon]
MISGKDLPEGWEWKKLGEVADVFNGKTPSTDEKKSSGHPVLKIKDIDGSGNFIGRFDSFVDEDFFNKFKKKQLRNGDTIILNAAHSSPYVGSKKAYVDFVIEPTIPTGEWMIIRSKSETFDNKFKHYFVNSRKISETISGLVRGIHLYPKDVLNLKIPFPPLPVQKKIVAILEAAEQLKEWRKKADKLTDEFLKSTFLEMFGDPVKNPKGWEVKMLGDVGCIKRGKSKHRPRNAPELLTGPYPLIQTGDVANSDRYIRKYHQTYSELGLSQSKMWPSGTLCITIAANIANTGILKFDSCFPDSIVGFTPKDYVKIEYVQYWISFLQKDIEMNAPESAQK